ncbi:MAG: hypothetical protein COW30_11320 [Rhodospirillales bacterium CG15_BIG_FIL_POST_REV_8_21_14_020_66_15]|nr:MAG: hypothetical protein COW30_11320 [Rhodospirillales bacterium CG15_BIG_FIL_POST_REV_8_21_14_020_66_15]
MSASILAFCVLILAGSASAETPKVLTWENLIPAGPPIENPYEHLTLDQQVELEMLAAIRSQFAAGLINEVHPMYEDGREIEHKLRNEGIDVDRMVGLVQKMQAKIAERNGQLAYDLDGQTVRLPGYVLPLEFEGTSVKEFLLVPYVGACIHVPPPPINQTVVVHLNQSYAAKELYEPVWVTGRMTVKQTKRALSLVDGSADVNAGYTIQGMRIDPYTEK